MKIREGAVYSRVLPPLLSLDWLAGKSFYSDKERSDGCNPSTIDSAALCSLQGQHCLDNFTPPPPPIYKKNIWVLSSGQKDKQHSFLGQTK